MVLDASNDPDWVAYQNDLKAGRLVVGEWVVYSDGQLTLSRETQIEAKTEAWKRGLSDYIIQQVGYVPPTIHIRHPIESGKIFKSSE